MGARTGDGGRIRLSPNRKGSDELHVSVDYIFVYPIEPPHQPSEWMRIVDEVVWTVGFADWQGAASSFTPWVITTGDGGVAGADCGTTDGYSHPDYTSGAVPGATPSVSPSGKPVDPYVAGRPRIGTCQATTGT